jgi:hypothetical protein
VNTRRRRLLTALTLLTMSLLVACRDQTAIGQAHAARHYTPYRPDYRPVGDQKIPWTKVVINLALYTAIVAGVARLALGRDPREPDA